jgi:hypothetical protein
VYVQPPPCSRPCQRRRKPKGSNLFIVALLWDVIRHAHQEDTDARDVAPLALDATRTLTVAEGVFGAATWPALRNDAVVALRQYLRNRRSDEALTLATLASTAVDRRALSAPSPRTLSVSQAHVLGPPPPVHDM